PPAACCSKTAQAERGGNGSRLKGRRKREKGKGKRYGKSGENVCGSFFLFPFSPFLGEAMTGPDIKMPLPGPKASAIISRDRAVVSPSYTRGYPLVIERGEGAFVEDVDGNVFLDCAAGIAVNSTGHSHPDVVRAIGEQAQRFLHMSGTDF